MNTLHLLVFITSVVSIGLTHGIGENLSLKLPDGMINSIEYSEPCLVNYSCLNCSTVRVCGPTVDGKLQEVKRYTCTTPTEWCDSQSGTCVAEQPERCIVPVPTDRFHCMRDGKFPILADCRSYYICRSGIAYLFKCPPSNVYFNPATEVCSSSSNCPSSSICSGKKGIKVSVVSNDKQLFAYCANDVAVTLDRCIGGYVFNSKTQTCEQSCPHEGLFPSAVNCTAYYKCSPTAKMASTFNITELTCPEGEGFQESAYQCVNKTLVKNCNFSLPAMMYKK